MQGCNYHPKGMCPREEGDCYPCQYKENSRKPIKEQDRPNVMPKYYCSKCNTLVGGYKIEIAYKVDHVKYCPFCGQEVDWSDRK
jgi:ribosomal protein L33